MPGEPKRLEHPKSVLIFGIIFKIITLVVFVGVAYHLTLSHHGPGVLIPMQKKMEEQQRSAIMDEVKKQEEYEVHRHFHNVVDSPSLPENVRPVCYICHSDYPHSKSKKVRALLNMHTQFFVCETCHIEERKGVKVVYKWYSPYNDNPPGPFFGTSYDPETGNLNDVEDQFSKIAPFYQYGDKLDAALKSSDAPLAKDYMNVRDKLTPEQRDNVKKKFHVDIKPKGHECKDCHSKKSILAFRDLGFDANRAIDIEQLNITGMITKYENFYIPKLFSY